MDELFAEYPPGSFASMARLGRHRWGLKPPDSGILSLQAGQLRFTDAGGAFLLDVPVATITEPKQAKMVPTAFGFVTEDGQRWDVSFADRYGYVAAGTPGANPVGLPVFHLDGDLGSAADLCDRWLAELRDARDHWRRR